MTTELNEAGPIYGCSIELLSFTSGGTGVKKKKKKICLGFLEPLCDPKNQPVFQPVLSRTIIVVAQHGRSHCLPASFYSVFKIFVLSRKTSMDQLLMMIKRHLEDHYVQDSILSIQPVEYDTPTDVVTVRNSGPNLLSLELTFRVQNQFIFYQNAPNGSNLGA